MNTDHDIAPPIAAGPEKSCLTTQQQLIESMRAIAGSRMFVDRTLQQALYQSARELEEATRDNAALQHSSAKLFAACQAAYRLSEKRRAYRGEDQEADDVEAQLRVALATARGSYR